MSMTMTDVLGFIKNLPEGYSVEFRRMVNGNPVPLVISYIDEPVGMPNSVLILNLREPTVESPKVHAFRLVEKFDKADVQSILITYGNAFMLTEVYSATQNVSSATLTVTLALRPDVELAPGGNEDASNVDVDIAYQITHAKALGQWQDKKPSRAGRVKGMQFSTATH